MNIVLVGSSGFLGRNLLQTLSRNGHACTVLTRHAAARQSLTLMPGVRLVQADPFDPAALDLALGGADALVSMAGILNERGRNGAGFHRVHVELVEALAEAARRASLRRVLHVSALNAGDGPSHYLRSKGAAENRWRESGLDVAVFRPSVIFGPGDSFFNRFAGLLRISPVLPLACPESRLQPVYVGDVTAAMSRVLSDGPVSGSHELGGPRVYSLRELVRFTATVIGRRRTVIGLPSWVSALQGRVMDFVPGKPFSTDNFRSLQVDNVTSDNALPALGIRPSSIEAVVPHYLGHSPRQNRLDHFRRSTHGD